MNILTKTITILTLIFCANNSFAQSKRDYLVPYIDSTSTDRLLGYKDKKGKIVIKAKYGEWGYDPNEKFYRVACVWAKNRGWVFINRKAEILFDAYIYDNGPDYFEEGLCRIVKNKKVGFADKNYNIVISPVFDFVTPFKNGLAEYYLGGERVAENGKTFSQMIKEKRSIEDLHWHWGGAVTETGYINKNGIRFKRVEELKNGTRHVYTKTNKHYLINKKGIIIKQL